MRHSAGRFSRCTSHGGHYQQNLLWKPLPQGWETGARVPVGGDQPLRIPDKVLQVEAILTLPDGVPFAEVVETYTRNILAFPPPS
jgi:hypothetical protein